MIGVEETRIIIDFFNNLCKTKNAGKYRNSNKMFNCASGRQLINLRDKLRNRGQEQKDTIDLTNKKVVFFDLDNTLVVNDPIHETKARMLLEQLVEKGEILVLVTYNRCPHEKLARCKFNADLFARIYQPEFNDEYIKYEYPAKSDSIISFLDEHDISKESAVFFDDLFPNIIGVRGIGVEAVLVDPCIGIPFEKLIY